MFETQTIRFKAPKIQFEFVEIQHKADKILINAKQFRNSEKCWKKVMEIRLSCPKGHQDYACFKLFFKSNPDN